MAHDLSVMVAQAGAARRIVTSRPQTAVTALASIEDVGRDALDGLRRLVTLLRTDRGRPERSPPTQHSTGCPGRWPRYSGPAFRSNSPSAAGRGACRRPWN